MDGARLPLCVCCLSLTLSRGFPQVPHTMWHSRSEPVHCQL